MGCIPSLHMITGGKSQKVTDISIAAPGDVVQTIQKAPSHVSAQNGGSGTLSRKDIKVPLTEKEAFAITKSWKAISRNMTNIGVAMFLR